MRTKIKLALLIAAIAMLLCGCNMLTVDELYCLPKRSENYANLQSAIDQAMTDLEYSAPIAGEHQQSVQAADLDGDGMTEYLVFAKGTGTKPLNILIFAENENHFSLTGTIESNGTAFEQVEYIRMDSRPGYELVVSTQVSEQVLRSVSVYAFMESKIEQSLAVTCSKFICNDLDDDGKWELMILRPGDTNTEEGIAELYGFEGGNLERNSEAPMSESVSNIKRMIVGNLEDGPSAIFVASYVDERTIVTDIFSVVDGNFVNVCKTNTSDTSVETLRNYYVYADDIDNDGVLELPRLIPMRVDATENAFVENQYLICWYSVTSSGERIDKVHTYHNFVGGWYLELDINSVERVLVQQVGSSYDVYFWDKAFTEKLKLLTVYALTGQKREEQAISGNRFVLYRGESVVYAAKLEAVSAAYGITKDKLVYGFHLILQDWKTGET